MRRAARRMLLVTAFALCSIALACVLLLFTEQQLTAEPSSGIEGSVVVVQNARAPAAAAVAAAGAAAAVHADSPPRLDMLASIMGDKRNTPLGSAFGEFVLQTGEVELLALMRHNFNLLPALWFAPREKQFYAREEYVAFNARRVWSWDEIDLSRPVWPRSLVPTVLAAGEDFARSSFARRAASGRTPERNVSLLTYSHHAMGRNLTKGEYTGNTRHVMIGVRVQAGETGAQAVDLLAKCKPTDLAAAAEAHKANGTAGSKTELLVPASFEPYMNYTYGISRLVVECGFGSFSSLAWNSAFRLGLDEADQASILWQAAFMSERFPQSATSFQRLNDNVAMHDALLSLLRRVPSWQVALLALHDVLFEFKDRHYANVLVDPWANLYNLDATQLTLNQASWRCDAVDSLFIPTTAQFSILRFGYSATILKKPNTVAKAASPMQLLDYRCHVPNGTIGSSFPEPMRRCMRHLVDTPMTALVKQYRLPPAALARLVKTATSLLEHGFERTIYNMGMAQQSRFPGRTFRWYDACCDIKTELRGAYKCIYAGFADWNALFGGADSAPIGHGSPEELVDPAP